MSDLLKIKEAIYEVGLLFNQQPSDEKITAYAKALVNYTPKQIVFAFNQVILSGSAFFPSLAEILKHLRPSVEAVVDRAPQVANEILKALRTYGPHDEANMLLSVSDDAKLTLQAIGYTGDIRNSENYETTKAQIERLARGVLASKDANTKNERLQKIGIDTKNVLSMNRPGMKAIDFSNFTTEPA
jgi:hypothetical protein